MKVLILGDGLLKAEIVEREVRNRFGHIEELEISNLTFEWPLEPFCKNEEISEFQGSETAIKEAIVAAECVILHASPISKVILEAAKNLKIIGVVRGGPKNINLAEATERGIPVINTPGRNAVAVVEFTVGLILAELKNIARAHANLMKGDWRYDYYLYDECKFELTDKVIGLVGFGNIAYRLSGILKAFGMKVVSCDPYTDAGVMSQFGVEKVEFDELIGMSDIVSVHARLTDETQGMFDKEVFVKMKPSALFVNTARGGLVNYDDLADALDNKVIACAALDVFEDEPVDFDSRIMKCSNITVTPHIAGATKDTVHYGLNLLLNDIERFVNGEKVENCLNPEVLTER